MMIKLIPNEKLTIADVPAVNDDWETISEFALTFDGYNAWGSFEKCAEIANAHKHSSLSELRTCLFFEQRRWRHFGETPHEDAMAYIRDVVSKIRQSLTQS